MNQNNNLKIILDTNILLVSIPSKSKYHWIFEKIVNKEITIAISNEILSEYKEIISKKFNSETAILVIEFLVVAENVEKTSIYYHWPLIPNDPDDNKFVDCYVASNADYIVTNDKHFKPLKDIEFPKINVIDINGFERLFE